MLGRTLQNQPVISTDETAALFEVVTDYTYALDTLDNYDYERLGPRSQIWMGLYVVEIP